MSKLRTKNTKQSFLLHDIYRTILLSARRKKAMPIIELVRHYVIYTPLKGRKDKTMPTLKQFRDFLVGAPYVIRVVPREPPFTTDFSRDNA